MKIFLFLTIASLLGSVSGPVVASMELAKKNHCFACHAVDHRVIGPSFKEIARKYTNDKTAQARLITKVKMGGGGVWGAIPMPPNPQLSDTDVTLLVDWILSVR